MILRARRKNKPNFNMGNRRIKANLRTRRKRKRVRTVLNHHLGRNRIKTRRKALKKMSKPRIPAKNTK